MEKIRALFTKQIIIATLAFTGILCLSVFLMQLFLSSTIPAGGANRYQVLITPADLDQIENDQNDALLTEAPTPTPRLEGVVEVGMQAVVFGTENRGLRMRLHAGFDSPVSFLAQEGEQVEITDGPLIEDGYIWWKLRSLEDLTKLGWSVQDFLQIDGQ